jgi:hypothetical protein
MPRNKTPGRRGESGNVFAIVMVGVVLFGALMFTFSRSARQGDTNLSRKQAEIAASDIMSYAQRVERGVARVMSGDRGCSESYINFVTPLYPDYPDNADAPTDKSCNVFDAAGGGVKPLPASGFGTNVAVRPSGGSALTGIGTSGASPDDHQDLVLWFSNIGSTLCSELNRRNGFDSAAPEVDNGQAWEFGVENAGNIWGGSIIDLGALSGHNAGCVHAGGTPMNDLHLSTGYHFYYVLWPR